MNNSGAALSDEHLGVNDRSVLNVIQYINYMDELKDLDEAGLEVNAKLLILERNAMPLLKLDT